MTTNPKGGYPHQEIVALFYFRLEPKTMAVIILLVLAFRWRLFGDSLATAGESPNSRRKSPANSPRAYLNHVKNFFLTAR